MAVPTYTLSMTGLQVDDELVGLPAEKSKYYQVPASDILNISNFDALVGVEWTVVGGSSPTDILAIDADTRDGVGGISLPSTNALAGVLRTLPAPLNFELYPNVELNYYADGLLDANVVAFHVRLQDSGGASYFFKLFRHSSKNVDGYNTLRFNIHSDIPLITSGVPDFTDINRIYIYTTDNTTTPFTVKLDSINAFKPQLEKGKVIFQWDDANDGVFTYVQAINDKYGFVGEVMVNGSTVDTAGKMTKAQLSILQGKKYSIADHSNTHINLTAELIADAEADVRAGKKYLVDDSFLGAGVLAYPFNAVNKEVRDMVAKYSNYARSSLSFAGVLNVYPFQDPHNIFSEILDSGSNLTSLKALVDIAEATKTVLIFYGHQGDDVTIYNDLCAYIKTKEVDVTTLYDLTKQDIAESVFEHFKSIGIILCTQQNKGRTLGGIIDSTKEYFITENIDMGTTSVTIPATGISLRGHSFDLSGLSSSENSYTMFTSIAGGCGNILGADYSLSVTGTSSKVYNLTSLTGNEAFEFERINYNSCTSLGTVTNFRQGLEIGTGRFGGTPTLTLDGAWSGGYRITTSIVRNLAVGMTGSLFESGGTFVMASRFLTDINCDLSASSSLIDFAPANFTNPSTLQFQSAIVTRNGVSNPEDSNLTPNIAASDLVSAWKNNKGLNDTFVGGFIEVATETTTTITTVDVFYSVAATAYTVANLVHMDSPAAGQLRHLGDNPREFNFTADYIVEGTSGNDLTLRVKKWDDSASGFVTVYDQNRPVNNLSGARNVAFFTINYPITLDQNDYVFLEVANHTTGSTVVTAENASFLSLVER